MRNFLNFFIPKEKNFFPLFEKASDNLYVISKVLVEMVNTSSPEKRIKLIKEIERLEHVGDNITHDIFNELNANFITPFDREDIHELSSSMDDIVDFIHSAAKQIDHYKLVEIPMEVIKLAELIMNCAEELKEAIGELHYLKHKNKIKESCVKINSIENHADDIFDMGIVRLFETEKDAIQIIKIKGVLAALETATDKCEDVANVLEQIIVKNA
ncbi:MAG: DUF47 family protein [Bacteroidota bacterium]